MILFVERQRRIGSVPQPHTWQAVRESMERVWVSSLLRMADAVVMVASVNPPWIYGLVDRVKKDSSGLGRVKQNPFAVFFGHLAYCHRFDEWSCLVIYCQNVIVHNLNGVWAA